MNMPDYSRHKIMQTIASQGLQKGATANNNNQIKGFEPGKHPMSQKIAELRPRLTCHAVPA